MTSSWLFILQLCKLKFFCFADRAFSIFILVINQLDAQIFCFTISLFHASTCSEHMCSSSGGQFCVSSWLITKINVNLRLTKTQLPLQYLHSSACSRTCFHFEVPHLSVLFCLTLLPQENRQTAGKRIQNIVLTGTPVYRYLPLSQEREFEPFMEMRCVRPLKCGEQLEVWTAKPTSRVPKLEYRNDLSFSIPTG